MARHRGLLTSEERPRIVRLKDCDLSRILQAEVRRPQRTAGGSSMVIGGPAVLSEGQEQTPGR
jgi:hypothetical protein